MTIYDVIEEGTYNIPTGCVAIIKNGTVTIRQSKITKELGLRCQDCKHFGRDYTFACADNKTDVCFLMPKKAPKYHPNKKLYYHRIPYAKPCEKFEPKEEKQ